MATGHHYGPAPVGDAQRAPDWSPTYYHRADTLGIGFDRTATGSNAVAQYVPPVRERYANRDDRPRFAAALVPSRAAGPTRCAPAARCGTSWSSATTPVSIPCVRCRSAGRRVRAVDRLRALRRSASTSSSIQETRSAVVARRGAHVLPDVLADADSGEVRAAGASARVLPADPLSGRIATSLAATRFPDPTRASPLGERDALTLTLCARIDSHDPHPFDEAGRLHAPARAPLHLRPLDRGQPGTRSVR